MGMGPSFLTLSLTMTCFVVRLHKSHKTVLLHAISAVEVPFIAVLRRQTALSVQLQCKL